MIARMRSLFAPTPLALALTLLIAAAALIVALAEAQIIRYVDFVYVLAENMLVIGALLSVLLALISRRADQRGDETGGTAAPSLIALVVGALGIVLLARYQEGLSLYDVLLAILLALAVEAGSSLLRAGGEDAPAEAVPPRFSGGSFAALVGILALTVLLRLLGPGSTPLVYLFAPLAVFVVPGLALSLALLDADAPPLAHAALAPALSIAVQAVYLAWLARLGIAISPLSIFAGVVGVTLIGAGVYALRRRRPLRHTPREEVPL